MSAKHMSGDTPYKIAVITDTHGNLPALKAALSAISKEGVDRIYHTGDAIGIGRFPKETVELLLETPNIEFVIGNHDVWSTYGIPDFQRTKMTEGQLAHQQWIHDQLTPDLKAKIVTWPQVITEDFGGVKTTFLHYALRGKPGEFKTIIKEPTVDDLDTLFTEWPSDIVFYGHHHPFSDMTGNARFINPGAL